MKSLIKLLLLIILAFILSCEDEDEILIEDSLPAEEEVNVDLPRMYLHNIPINHDTLFLDYNYNIDYRIEIEDHQVDSIIYVADGKYIRKQASPIIKSKKLGLDEGLHTITYFIRATENQTKEVKYFKTYELKLCIVKNLSSRYVRHKPEEGRLKLTWPEFDKENTAKYLIERYVGQDMEYCQEIEVQEPILIDDFYVGEEVNYRISVIDSLGSKYNIWYYKKSKEESPTILVTQNPSGGYSIHFSRCKYYNNFQSYYLTTSLDFYTERKYLFSSMNIEDTVYNNSDAEFSSHQTLWLRYLPKKYPNGVSDADWRLYGNFFNVVYGLKSFDYSLAEILNQENIVYTIGGNIYKYNTISNRITDSIIYMPDYQGVELKTTPTGKFIYAYCRTSNDEHPISIWSANSFKTNPDYIFSIDYWSGKLPPISDNLLMLRHVPSNTSDTNFAIYDATNGNNIFTTDYHANASRLSISSDGVSYIINNNELKLFQYENGNFQSIVEVDFFTKQYIFSEINPLNSELSYFWEGNKTFSIKRTQDFTEINSFTLDVNSIVNIDYYSNKILGFSNGKLQIYNLQTGILEKEIRASYNSSVPNIFLLGNIIYGKTSNNIGVKYFIEE